MVTISDPHIKRAAGYHVHEEAQKLGYYVKNSEGNDYEGHCWPGSSSWLDFLNPKVRQWYASLYAYDKYQGSTKSLYTWIDMNEPSVFSGPEVTMHKNAIHHGGIEHKEVHNLYGFYQSMAVYQGHVDRQSGQDRPFILSRAFFAGSQRYVAVWTGDNQARWDHLESGSATLLTLGISGLQFVGADVGGFFDNPSTELLVRFYQAGAFYPFFRGHAEIQTKRREPWLFGEENTKLIRASIIRRYNLIPYYYTLFYHCSYTGWPIMRPLFMEYSNDPKTLGMQDQFLIGDSLLVKPVVTEGQTSTNVYIPAGQPWFDYETGEKYSSYSEHTINTPMNKIPVFQKGGSIIPLKKRVRKSTFQMKDDPYTLQIALDSKGKADGDLYVDDGHSFNYKNNEFTYRKFTVEKSISSTIIECVTSHPLTRSGYKLNNTVERIVIFGLEKEPKSIKAIIPELKDPTLGVDGGEMELDFEFINSVLTIRTKSLPIFYHWKVILN
jgi:mannosyl-oligosaccharide alpha-1,3-glucosidase